MTIFSSTFHRPTPWALCASAAICAVTTTDLSYACGGFFCSRTPVDQTAERILFAVGETTTTMAVQIQYSGAAPDFAWVLPLAEVPDPNSLAVFPQRAFTALDANSGPIFNRPNDPACWNIYPPVFEAAAGGGADAGASPSDVTIHFEVEVGPYSAAVVESDDPTALVTWLRDNDYRVGEEMEPYINVYTSEGMKFLALRLLPEQGAEDIQPLEFTLPGTSPSIPIRLTALAAEPEMSLLVFVLGSDRYEGANWTNIDIADNEIRWRLRDYWQLETNWPALVARKIDDAGGHGWVTEMAGPTQPFADLIASQTFTQPEDEAAASRLLELFQAHPYISRLYARVSAEEMSLDPIFRQSDGGDVDRARQLSRYVGGDDLCASPDGSVGPPPGDPCDFVTCGAGGECFHVDGTDAGGMELTGCACIPGATARTTFAPSGDATVICQDARMSFLNPGDQTPAGETLPDPCAGYDCGLGKCVAINMTPTCVCDEGAVAIGSFGPEGERMTRCVVASDAIPPNFYDRRLPALPTDLPGGTNVDVEPPPDEPVDPVDPDPSDPTGPGDSGALADGGVPAAETRNSRKASGGGGLCAVRNVGRPTQSLLWFGLGAAALLEGRRRRRRR